MSAVLTEVAQVTRVFHPEPPVELIELANGTNAQVVVGDAGYQITTGELIAV